MLFACLGFLHLPQLTHTLSRSFYPATVYLSTSKLAVAVCGNLVFASALLGQSLLIKVRSCVRVRVCASIQLCPNPDA